MSAVYNGRMKLQKTFIIILTAFLGIYPGFPVRAETLSGLELVSGEKLLITEVNFKNKHEDWIKIYYESPTSRTLNIKGLMFQDDKIFKTVTKDYFIQNGDEVILRLKNNSVDNGAGKVLFSEHAGLTATTEQVVIRDQNKIFDIVCWSSSRPTAQEQKDLEKLFEAKAWISKNLSDCIPSEGIKTNQSIARKDKSKDTDSKNDWRIKPLPPPPKTSPKTSDNTEKKKLSPLQKNGTTSKNIMINEFLPNPPKGHSAEEWIELANIGNKDIDLAGWQIDDGEKGSRPWMIPKNTFIKAHGFLLIPKKISKLSLGNSEDEVRLLDGKGKLLQSVKYKEAPAGSSYSWIDFSNTHKKKWLWQKNPTPDRMNPEHMEIAGIIVEGLNTRGPYFFILQTQENHLIKIFFEENIIPLPLATITFVKDTAIKVEAAVKKNENKFPENTVNAVKKDEIFFDLENYEVISSPSPNHSSDTPFIAIGLVMLGGIGFSIKYGVLRWPIKTK